MADNQQPMELIQNVETQNLTPAMSEESVSSSLLITDKSEREIAADKYKFFSNNRGVQRANLYVWAFDGNDHSVRRYARYNEKYWACMQCFNREKKRIPVRFGENGKLFVRINHNCQPYPINQGASQPPLPQPRMANPSLRAPILKLYKEIEIQNAAHAGNEFVLNRLNGNKLSNAIKIIFEAVKIYSYPEERDSKKMGNRIKEDMQKLYGGVWQCFVDDHVLNHSFDEKNDCYLEIKLEDLYILLFRSR